MQHPPPDSEPGDRVVPLRTTAASRRRDTERAANQSPATDQPQIGDLDRYPQTNEADDYRHRMTTNIAGIAIAAILIVTGIWIANTMASMRKNQDCVLSGRRGCTPVDAPVPPRW